jgi:hypothetical protein
MVHTKTSFLLSATILLPDVSKMVFFNLQALCLIEFSFYCGFGFNKTLYPDINITCSLQVFFD